MMTESSPPSEVVSHLDILIDSSPDITDFQRRAHRKVLRVMFWMGESLKRNGVDERFIRTHLPPCAPRIKVSQDPWSYANNKVDSLYKFYYRNRMDEDI